MRQQIKKVLAVLPQGRAVGSTFLIYHRVGGGSTDELDLSVASFREQVDVLADHRVTSIDEATDALGRGDVARARFSRADTKLSGDAGRSAPVSFGAGLAPG